jgi:hypothetical protein
MNWMKKLVTGNRNELYRAVEIIIIEVLFRKGCIGKAA